MIGFLSRKYRHSYHMLISLHSCYIQCDFDSPTAELCFFCNNCMLILGAVNLFYRSNIVQGSCSAFTNYDFLLPKISNYRKVVFTQVRHSFVQSKRCQIAKYFLKLVAILLKFLRLKIGMLELVTVKSLCTPWQVSVFKKTQVISLLN